MEQSCFKKIRMKTKHPIKIYFLSGVLFPLNLILKLYFMKIFKTIVINSNKIDSGYINSGQISA